jgi:hypothetical protein
MMIIAGTLNHRSLVALAAGLAAFASSPASAQGDPVPFLVAPASGTQAPEAAAVFNLKLHLANGRGLVQSLLDTGVTTDDAQLAGRLAASALKEKSGCAVTVSLSRGVDSNELRLVRVVLVTAATQTVLERRNGELTLAGQAASETRGSIV